MWFEHCEIDQFRIHVTVRVHEEKCTEFNELSLYAFVEKLRYRVVKVDYVFGCSDWKPRVGMCLA